MTSHDDSHTTIDVKPEIILGVQTGNGIPHDKYNSRGIAHTRTNNGMFPTNIHSQSLSLSPLLKMSIFIASQK